MERSRALTLTAGLAAALALGSAGCLHVTVDADGKVKSVAPVLPTDAKPKAESKPEAKAEPPKVDPQVKPASASAPAPPVLVPPVPSLSLAKLTGKDGARGTASTILAVWQNRVASLPDPTQGGKMGTGLVGQLFLFGPNDKFAPAGGRVTIELFDDTPKPGRPAAEPAKLGQWVFEKETLAKLMTTDERFGKCYTLFLPWPTYKPEVARIRLAVRYDQENSYPLYADVSTITLDAAGSGAVGATVVPNNPAGFAGPGLLPPTVNPAAFAAPIPLGGGPATATPPPGAFAPPPGLTPLVITAPGR